MPELTGKVAIITGSATGVGAAAAILLAERGINVVINYTRSHDEAEATAATCREKGVEAITVRADVSEDADCKRMVQEAIDKWGRIDYLINNAARTKFNPFPNLDGVDKDDFLNIYAVNVVGAYQMVRAVEPHMRKLGRGAIVNDSSIGGVTGIASSIPYAASKAALNLMTKSLAHVLGPEIRINAVVPGMIQTRWLKGGLGDEQYEAMLETTAATLPLREVATAEDIAETLIWFLIGAGSRLITGETLIVDSGIHLGRLPPYAGGEEP
ncbi:MAG: SDR family oxidoreductase [Gammaproteobacteria bacterium]|nr:MAG: SDR family oxidoreductase [Gammaproteobacteria bacterium]